jgi:hypothetical protein
VATILKEWTKGEMSCHSFFMDKNVPSVEIHRELVTVYGANVMIVQHVRKWCWEFDSGQVNVMNKGVVARPRLLILFRILMQQCKQTRVSSAQLEIRFNLSRHHFGHCS